MELIDKNHKKLNPNFVIIIILVAITLFIYGKTWKYDFVCYDDPLFIEEPIVKSGLSFESIKWAFTDATLISNYWIPLTWLSFIIDTEIFGNNPGGFHFTNTVLHIINSILLFIFCLKIFRSTFPSAIVAFLFAVHPIHVESVAWITCRKDMLCGLFWIAGLIAYVEYSKYVDDRKEGSFYKKINSLILYIKVLIFFFMGLMSKPMILTFPFTLLLLDFLILNRVKSTKKGSHYINSILRKKGAESSFTKSCYALICCLPHKERGNNITPSPVGRDREGTCLISLTNRIAILVIEKAPFFLIVTFLSALTYITQKNGNVLTISTEHYTLPLRFFNSFVAYMFYIKKLFLPIGLALLYTYPEKIDFFNHSFSFILIFCITILSIVIKKKYPFFIFGWLWFLGTLVPVIGIYIIGLFLYTDRYAYIPLIGIYIVIACLIEKFIENRPYQKKSVISLTIIVISIFAIISFMQVTYWKNSFTLFHRAIAINPNNSIAHNNLGYTYMRMGQFDNAKHHLIRAIEITPNYFAPYYNLAGTFYLTKHYHKAILFYKKTVELKPQYATAHLNMGIAFMDAGYFNEALEAFSKCIDIAPNSKDYNRANFFINKIYVNYLYP